MSVLTTIAVVLSIKESGRDGIMMNGIPVICDHSQRKIFSITDYAITITSLNMCIITSINLTSSTHTNFYEGILVY